jgi:hypothetical protein
MVELLKLSLEEKLDGENAGAGQGLMQDGGRAVAEGDREDHVPLSTRAGVELRGGRRFCVAVAARAACGAALPEVGAALVV